MHVHGGGGASFTEGPADDARRAAEFHRGHGSTTIVASLVTAPLADLEARAAMLAGLAGQGVIAGIHLEGPFLSAARCGAQDPRHMLAPDVAAFERLHAAAAGHLRVITIAPELPGAAGLIKAAVRVGVTAAVGHTDATADDHLGRRRRRRDPRDPPVQRHAAAASPRAGAGRRAARPGRGHLRGDRRRRAPARHRDPPDGPRRRPRPAGPDHRRDGGRRNAGWQLPARVDAGRRGRGSGPPRRRRRARYEPAPALGRGGAIAGSTATMADVVRHAVAAGLPVTTVAAAASTTPARVLGLGDRTGALRAGLDADLVVCDEEFRLRAVMRQGEWLAGQNPKAGLSSARAPNR